MTSITYTKDGKYILAGTEDYPNKLIWNLKKCRSNKEHMLVKADIYKRELDNTFDTFSVYNISASADSKLFATRGEAGITKLWHIKTRQLVQELTDNKNKINFIQWSPVENIFAIGCQNGDIKLYGKTFR